MRERRGVDALCRCEQYGLFYQGHGSGLDAVIFAHGRRIGKSRIERLIHAHGLSGAVNCKRRPRTTDSDHTLPIAPNLLERDFSAPAQNTVWVADITYVATGEGWLYLASMSRKGDCLDNAAMESFWHTLKTERVYRTEYATKDEARRL